MSNYIYMESIPKLSGKAREFGAGYRRMAVVETVDGFIGRPKMISNRAIGVVRIVEETTASVGKTERSFGFLERKRMKELADQLNGN